MIGCHSHFVKVSNVVQLVTFNLQMAEKTQQINNQLIVQYLTFLKRLRLEPVKILTLGLNQWLQGLPGFQSNLANNSMDGEENGSKLYLMDQSLNVLLMDG